MSAQADKGGHHMLDSIKCLSVLLGLSICHMALLHLVQDVETGLELLEEKAPGGHFKGDQCDCCHVRFILVSPEGGTTRLSGSTVPTDRRGHPP